VETPYIMHAENRIRDGRFINGKISKFAKKQQYFVVIPQRYRFIIQITWGYIG